jgi:hypothetical protein
MCPLTIRRSGPRRRENVWSPDLAARSLRLRGASPQRKLHEESGTREVRVHVVQLGGRNRSDASRVFSTGRSQGLLVTREGASLEEVRSTA